MSTYGGYRPDETEKIYRFLASKKLDTAHIIKACKSYEEVCSLMFHEWLGDIKTFDVMVEYGAGENKFTMSFAPHSLSYPDLNPERFASLLEYKLISYYSVDRYEEQSDKGIGVRFTLSF